MHTRIVSGVVLLLLAGRPVAAQIGVLDKVFSNVTDMNAHLLFGKLGGGNTVLQGQPSGPDLRGVGFEISLSVAQIILRKPVGACAARKAPPKYTLEEVTTTTPGEGPDSPRAQRTYSVGEGELKPTKECPDPPAINVELALGYSQLSGFRGRSLELRTSIEELPSLTTYFTLATRLPISPYLGLRTGLTQLKGMRFIGVDSLPPSPGAGSTYHLGLAPGVVVGGDEWGIFAEFAWTYRRIPHIDWSAAKSRIPAELLGDVKLDTWAFAVGLQVGIGSSKDQ